MDLPRLERWVAKNQHEMENECNNFMQQLSGFVNQKISQFWHKLTFLKGTSQKIKNIDTQVREMIKAMTERLDKVEHQLESIHASQKEEAESAVEYGIFELKTEILCEVDKEVTTLETKVEIK